MYRTAQVLDALSNGKGRIALLSGRTIARAAGLKPDSDGRIGLDKFDDAHLAAVVSCCYCGHTMSLFAALIERKTQQILCSSCK